MINRYCVNKFVVRPSGGSLYLGFRQLTNFRLKAELRTTSFVNKRAMLKYLTGAQRDLYTSPAVTITRGATIWKQGSALDYTQIFVVGGEANDEGALLKVQGVRRRNRIVGRVMMILEDGEWKVDREDWVR